MVPVTNQVVANAKSLAIIANAAHVPAISPALLGLVAAGLMALAALRLTRGALNLRAAW